MGKQVINIELDKALFDNGPKTPLDGRYGFWGTVTEAHPENNTVHVMTDTRQEIAGVRVASHQWVVMDNKESRKAPFLSGTIDLPPVGAFVFCLVPNGEISSAFVLCSGYAMRDASHAALRDGAKGEEFFKKEITPAGWTEKVDRRTGTVRIADNPLEGAETVSLEIDQEAKGSETVTVKAHGTTITIDRENGVRIETGGKYFIGNSLTDLLALMNGIIDKVTNIKTAGSPGAHVIDPASVKELNGYKAEFGKLLAGG
jgi:hypothetical protein